MPDNTSDHESFADLFKEDTVTNKQLSPGQKIQATIVDVSQDSIFLILGKKAKASLTVKNLKTKQVL